MYTNTLIASVAVLAGSAIAATPGKAVIVNGCTYPVSLAAVPAANGGYTETQITLAHGQSWSQQWTQLSNGAGWSLKLYKDQDWSHPLQYEYTYQGDDTIWYDLSCVDGNPWNGNWEVTASGNKNCLPKQSFYRYATDDAFGMQSCPMDSDITVTLCSGEDQAESIVSAVIASSTPPAAATSAATTVQQATTTSEKPSTTSTTTAQQITTIAEKSSETAHAHVTTTGHALAYDGAHYFNADVKQATTPTTFTTQATAAVLNEDGNVVVVVETVVETAVAYETYVPGKRHVHHPDHPHFR